MIILGFFGGTDHLRKHPYILDDLDYFCYLGPNMYRKIIRFLAVVDFDGSISQHDCNMVPKSVEPQNGLNKAKYGPNSEIALAAN